MAPVRICRTHNGMPITIPVDLQRLIVKALELSPNHQMHADIPAEVLCVKSPVLPTGWSNAGSRP